MLQTSLYTFERQTHILPINTICINYKALCIVKNSSQTDALVIWRAYHDSWGPGMSRKYVTLYLGNGLSTWHKVNNWATGEYDCQLGAV